MVDTTTAPKTRKVVHPLLAPAACFPLPLESGGTFALAFELLHLRLDSGVLIVEAGRQARDLPAAFGTFRADMQRDMVRDKDCNRSTLLILAWRFLRISFAGPRASH